jgi:hypothetical protein
MPDAGVLLAAAAAAAAGSALEDSVDFWFALKLLPQCEWRAWLRMQQECA